MPWQSTSQKLEDLVGLGSVIQPEDVAKLVGQGIVCICFVSYFACQQQRPGHSMARVLERATHTAFPEAALTRRLVSNEHMNSFGLAVRPDDVPEPPVQLARLRTNP